MARRTPSNIPDRRLRSQRIAGAGFETPGAVVAWMGAVQAQDYLGALWALGVRMETAREEAIEQAIAGRTVVRTWPMRGTLHFVAPADIRWMLALLTPRVIAGQRSRHRQLELDQADFDRSRDLLTRALEGGRQLTRDAAYQTLEAAGVSTAGQRGIHILGRLAQDGHLCFAGRQGKQQTFALLEEWVPAAKPLARDEALAELAGRYFTSHGPATIQDFTWWSGLTVADAKVGIELAGMRLEREVVEGLTYWSAAAEPAASPEFPTAYLLPPFDEYTVAYRDRSAVLDPSQRGVLSSNGIFYPIIVLNGQVAGTWKRVFKKGAVVISLSPFSPLKKKERQAVAAAAERYGVFLGMPMVLDGSP
ncbi:MAG TPA: winged helix DNA-binding domain-containing protein [Thermoanaerobaculia bacterium]|nr:winged helix DNA-binding domain-containing protein [Thermoanaerobaculia bacterium]